MTEKSVQSLIEDIRLLSETNFEIVQAVRLLVHQTFDGTSEEIKYGGILFSSPTQFGGVFAYKGHVTLEFSSGAKIDDAFGFLEGSGKKRRHIKLSSVSQIAEKRLSDYLPSALEAAEKEKIKG
jgi:hypothetical protein